MEKYEELEARMSKMEEEIVNIKQNISNGLFVDVPIVGGLDDGRTQTLSVPMLLQSVIQEIGISPVFRRNLEFIKTKEQK
jgi:hypothetical protein